MRFTHLVITSITCLFAGSLHLASCAFPPDHDFSQAHSYPSNTSFDPRDGWKRITITDLSYKYPNLSISPAQQTAGLVSHQHGRRSSLGRVFGRRVETKTASKKPKKKTQSKNVSNAANKPKLPADVVRDANVGGLLNQAMKGIGKTTSVVVTWYSGNDLKNPSCWSGGSWTPTDQSFVCALTLEGWINRPPCFSFLELCHGPSKCIFVRVVDTCAGCSKGSHHVDLTRNAFSKLASLDTGILNVDMRPAQLPSNAPWNNALWGPKH